MNESSQFEPFERDTSCVSVQSDKCVLNRKCNAKELKKLAIFPTWDPI